MPTFEFTPAFSRLVAKLSDRDLAALRAARDKFVAHMTAHGGFVPPFPASLRIHKLGGHNRWSLSFGDGMRAVFQIGDEVRPGEVHIIWEFVGDHDAYDRAY